VYARVGKILQTQNIMQEAAGRRRTVVLVGGQG
jgi:hypothetical protein